MYQIFIGSILNSRTLRSFLVFLLFLLIVGSADLKPSYTSPAHRPASSPSSNIFQWPSHRNDSQSMSLEKRGPKESCVTEPLTNQTWMGLELDRYLETFPNGHKITLTEYAAQVGASNFVCGIGAGCHAGQMCSPISNEDWYILFAVQQWNTQVNQMHTAIETAIQTVSDSMTSLINQLFPSSKSRELALHAKEENGITAAFTQVSGSAAIDIMFICGVGGSPMGWIFDFISMSLVAGFSIWALVQEAPPGPVRNSYDVYAQVNWGLERVKQNAQARLSVAVQEVITSPISSKKGISGALMAGQFISPLKLITAGQITESIYNVTLAMGLNIMFKTMNAFITVGANMCTDKGVNGAWPQPKRLSHCNFRGGKMQNIIKAQGDKSINNFDNAEAISRLWGFSTKMIVTNAIKCQQTYKTFRYNPYTHRLPKSVDSECIFNLPVCFVDEHTAVWNSIRKNHQHVAEACRKHAHLPI